MVNYRKIKIDILSKRETAIPIKNETLEKKVLLNSHSTKQLATPSISIETNNQLNLPQMGRSTSTINLKTIPVRVTKTS